MNRFQRAFRATVVESGFGYASQALALFSVPLFLTTLGAEGYGLMVTVMAFTGYLNFADAGLSWGSMILIAHAHGRQDRAAIASITRHSVVLAAVSGLVALLALGAVVGASALGWQLPMFAHHPEANQLLLIAGVQLILNIQFGVFYNVFKGLQETYWAVFYQGTGRILGLGATMLAAYLTHSVALVMFLQLVFTALCGTAAAIDVVYRHRWAFTRGSFGDRSQYAAQIRIGGKNFLMQIGHTLTYTAPTFGLGAMVGLAAVPFYTVPVALLSLFFTPLNSWAGSMQGAYGEAWSSGARDWAAGAFRKTLDRMLVVGALGVALFLSFGDGFIRLWSRGRLNLTPAMAASVSAIVVANSLVKAAQFLLTGLNRQRQAAVAEIVSGALSMVLVPLSVHFLGAAGVGVGAIAAILVTSGWVLPREVQGRLGAAAFPTAGYTVRVGAALGATTLVGNLVAGLVRFEGAGAEIWRLASGGIAGVAVFLLAVFGLRLVPLEEAQSAARWLFRRRSPAGS